MLYSKNPLTMNQIFQLAPSVFATEPYGKMSDKYRMVPTAKVVESLMDTGFQPMYAGQARTRIEGKAEFTRHVLRFRHKEFLDAGYGADAVPELVLLNSHDGSSAYKLMLGMFRTVCANGMIVKSGSVTEMSVRHSGKPEMVGEVIDASYEVIKQAPAAICQVAEWKGQMLTTQEQLVYAKAAYELRDTKLEVHPTRLLAPRREADRPDSNGERTLWNTFNVVQESLVRGGAFGQTTDAKGYTKMRRLRDVKSIETNRTLNRALWELTEGMAKLKMAA